MFTSLLAINKQGVSSKPRYLSISRKDEDDLLIIIVMHI